MLNRSRIGRTACPSRACVHAATMAALLAGACFVPSTALATVVAQYNFTGTSLATSTVAPNTSAGNVNFTGSAASQFSLVNILAINANGSATTAASAFSNNSFFQFTVTPGAGFELDLTSLTFKATYGSPGSGFAVRSSVDGYTSELLAAVIPTANPTYTDYSASLSAPAFQDLTVATTFRIYVYHGVNGGPAAAFDDLTLNSAVSPTTPSATNDVPAPATHVLVLAGLGAAVATRRRCGQRRTQRGN